METNSIIEQILLTYKLVRGVEDHHVQACFIQADNKSRHYSISFQNRFWSDFLI